MASVEEQQQLQKNIPEDNQQEEVVQGHNDQDQVNHDIENIDEQGQEAAASLHDSKDQDDQEQDQLQDEQINNEENPNQQSNNSAEAQEIEETEEQVKKSKNQNENDPHTEVQNDQNKESSQEIEIPDVLDENTENIATNNNNNQQINEQNGTAANVIDSNTEDHTPLSKISQDQKSKTQPQLVQTPVKKSLEKATEKERQLATMNIAIGGSAEGTENHQQQSPFKNQNEREDILKIFQSQQPVSLEEANKQEHFQPDSKYAPLIRRLRQQNNFDDFVRSYNSLNLVNPQQQQQNKPQQQLLLQQQPYDPFASLLSQTNGSNLFQSQQNHLNTSPSRPTQDKYQTLTFSPLKNSFEPSKDQLKDFFSSANKAQPQRHSYLDVFSQKQERTSQSSFEFFKNQTSADRPQNNQAELFSSQKQSLNIMSSNDRGFAKLAQSTYVPANEDPQSPNQRRLDKLKKKVNVGIESLQNIHRNQEFASPNFKSRVTGGKGNVRDQFKQFMGQSGLEGQAKSSGQKSSQDTNKFDEILNKFSAKGGDKKENISLDARRQSGVRIEGFGQSQTTSHGIHGQMKRVEQIQTSLRTLPKKTTTSKPTTKLSTESGLNGLSDWKISPKFEGASSSKVFQSSKGGQAGYFSKRNQQK